jgi:two-component system, sensor histidine kinase and response regulator
MRILITDDSPRNLKVLREALEARGHEVIEAGNGVRALAILESEAVDAVISDIMMPLMDGFRLCREIRNSSMAYRSVPLMLYTASFDTAEDRELAAAIGADSYILRPAPVEALMDEIAKAIQQGAARPSTARNTKECDFLPRYNTALVQKLEIRNIEKQSSQLELKMARAQIVELNLTQEARVSQRTAALDAANEELEAFSISVAHDLRAPLHRIDGLTQSLESSAVARLQQGDLETLTQITGVTRQMNQLIDALLQFARTSKTSMHFRPVDLGLIINSVIADLQPELKGRVIEWRREPIPSVHGDAILLRQVLINLISNAVKFSRTKEAAVIEIGTRPGRKDEVVLFVRDNGVGFDPRYAQKLFGAFERLHRQDQYEGTGIGLANAQRIIARHGGSIWADASVGKGATFCFSLPNAPQTAFDPLELNVPGPMLAAIAR